VGSVMTWVLPLHSVLSIGSILFESSSVGNSCVIV
jgi:hypothetical protein